MSISGSKQKVNQQPRSKIGMGVHILLPNGSCPDCLCPVHSRAREFLHGLPRIWSCLQRFSEKLQPSMQLFLTRNITATAGWGLVRTRGRPIRPWKTIPGPPTTIIWNLELLPLSLDSARIGSCGEPGASIGPWKAATFLNHGVHGQVW